MQIDKPRRVAVGIGCAVALAYGMSAPAFAESTVYGRMRSWDNGTQSNDWHDYAKNDGVETHVTFYDGCTREFRARIRKNNFGPDTTVGSEWINCGSYDDAVRVGVLPAEDYHFDVQDIAGGSCGKFSCDVGKTSGSYREYW